MGAAGRSQDDRRVEVWMPVWRFAALYGSHRRRGDTILHHHGRQCRGGRSDYYRSHRETLLAGSAAGWSIMTSFSADIVSRRQIMSAAALLAAIHARRSRRYDRDDPAMYADAAPYNRIRAAIKYASEGGR